MAEVVFELVDTGRTHQVGGSYELILGENGEPEQEWALAAVVDGHHVILERFSVGYVDHMVSRPDTEVSSSGSSTSSAGTAADGAADDREQLLARIAELEAQVGEQTGDQPPPPPAPNA